MDITAFLVAVGAVSDYLCIFAKKEDKGNMALIKSYKGRSPRWGSECYFSENATLVGDVTLGVANMKLNNL